jgi:hypothetical protein
MCGESIVETIGENRVTMSSVLAEPVMKVAPTAQAPRWVVARFADGGIGDHVSCLMGSWWYARQTGRTLVIDWRGSRFNSRRGDGRNGVGELFEIGTTLAGVPTIADDSVAQLPFSDDAYPAKWSAAHLAGVQHVGHTPEEIVAVGRLVGAGQEVPQAWVAFNQWIDPPPPRDEARRLLAELQFTAPIRVAADRWFGAHVGTRHAVAIHIRHGNGENIGWRAAYWLDPWRFTRQCLMNALTDVHRPGRHGRFGDNMPDSLVRTESLRGSELAFLRRIAQRVAVMRARLGDAVPVLFCDSQVVAETARQLMPDLQVPPKTFLAPNAGPLHATTKQAAAGAAVPSMQQVTQEMCVEMELMRRCSALVCMASGFSIFSRVSLDPDYVEELQAGWFNRKLDRAVDRLPLQRLRAWWPG